MTTKTEKTQAAPADSAPAEFLINDQKVTAETKVSYVPNPKRPNSRAWERYEAYQSAKTIGEYLELNNTKYAKADLRHDLGKEFLKIES